MHACVGLTVDGACHWVVGCGCLSVNCQWGIRSDVCLCSEKMFLLLMLTLFLLLSNRLVQWYVLGVGLVVCGI